MGLLFHLLVIFTAISIVIGCSKDSFVCSDGSCIPWRWVCDTEEDCENGSDEQNCASTTAATTSTTMLPTEPVNEPDVPIYTCHNGFYFCDGFCFDDHTWCDNKRDCPYSGIDEQYCGKTTLITVPTTSSENPTSIESQGPCPSDYFLCDNSCYPIYVWCDKKKDCPNGIDEKYCASYKMNETTISISTTTASPYLMQRCPEGTFLCDYYCYSNKYKCDGVQHCRMPNDEEDCEMTTPSTTTLAPATATASEGSIIIDPPLPLSTCPSNMTACGMFCVPIGYNCNAIHVKCDQDHFMCGDGYCIPEKLQCNMVPNCRDGSDEINCTFPSAHLTAEEIICITGCLSRPQLTPHCPQQVVIKPIEVTTTTTTSSTTTTPTTTTTTTTTTPRPPIRICPIETYMVGDHCVFVQDNYTLNWPAAKMWCEANNMYLLEINSGTFMVQLQIYLQQNKLYMHSYWVGLNDLEVESKWKFVESDKEVTLGTPLWGVAHDQGTFVQQPSGGIAQNCAMLEYCPFSYLDDHDCSEIRHFICEAPMTIITP